MERIAVDVHDLPTINAILNTACTLCLSLGYVAIRRQDRQWHRRWMLAAASFSATFLVSYSIYHVQAGSVPYPLHDWTRYVYFAVLLPHIVMAVVTAPFILLVLRFALTGQFHRHAPLARRVWPAWMFVSLSGVVVYLLLYQWAGGTAA
jgi:putative membrane protein